MNPALETLMLARAAVSGGDAAAPCLFLGAEAHPALRDCRDLLGWQVSKPKAEAWEAAGFTRTDVPDEGQFPMVLLLPGKSRDEILHGFSLARDRVAEGGHIVVALSNQTGAARFEKEFARATGGVESIQKHKCRGFFACARGGWDEALFDEWRDLGRPRAVAGSSWVTVPGVFSDGRVDAGSALLARHLPAGAKGRAADLGAGWGYLSGELLRRCPGIATVDLYEADSRALGCARANLAGESPGRVAFHWHDVSRGVPGGYDVVVMNPPFHDGRQEDVDLGRSFLAAAAGALRRGGRLFLVANRQLPYESDLAALGFSFRSPAEDGTYKLIFGEKR